VLGSHTNTVVDVSLTPLLTHGLEIGIRIKDRPLLRAAQREEKAEGESD
jgi:hypothetical protein